MITQEKYANLAAKFFGKTFAAAAHDCVFVNTTGWNNSTQTATTETQTVKAIRIEFDQGEFNGQDVMVGDYKLIAQNLPLTIVVKPDSTGCTYRGEVLDIKSVNIDPLDISIIFHVRRK